MGPCYTVAVAEERDDDAAEGEDDQADDGGDDDAPARPETSSKQSAAAAPKRGLFSRVWWLLPLVMVVEFYAYGRNGVIEVCVGKEGQTDFNLRPGDERTDDTRWKFPRCETRYDLGLRSNADEAIDDALDKACRGATLFQHRGEMEACQGEADGWKHEIDKRFCPPWDPHYYEHLFWFLK